MNNNEWKKVCAACAEGTPPARCAYYGDPNGCNAPTLGKHPEGDLAERLQEELEKAERRIAELERAPCNAAALREALERIVQICHDLEPLFTPHAIQQHAEAALAAPARNCDRFATAEEARRAFESAHSHGIVRNLYTAAFDWLFDKAKEGGDHA